ncbi:MAG: carboxypeptidase regulatory-like domain-containing protein [Bacteroidaceae bacterium]|nr:carboxypeptidase regulatory-like domain-containing protein [Bacteroidaceae bacterium]
MKKFFSLKMALAVLVAGAAFTSCSDSDAGDIYVPGTTPGGSTTVNVVYPAAKYVVNGVVTDAATSAAIEGVAVSGAVTATTDANGFFTSGAQASPLNGVVTFTKDGYTTVNRTLVMVEATTGVVSEAMNVVMTTGSAVEPEGELVVPDPTATVLLNAVEVPAPELTSLVNDSNEDKTVMLSVTDLDLPYGAVVPAGKGAFEDALAAFVKYHWGNDPFVGYIKFTGSVPVVIPAGMKVVKLIVTPVVVPSKFILGDEEQDLDVIDQYQASPACAPVDAHDPHDAHNGDNVGGGDSQGV